MSKAVVGGTAGPAMAVPLFWPKMVLAGPLFWPIMIFFAGSFFPADHDDQRLSNNFNKKHDFETDTRVNDSNHN